MKNQSHKFAIAPMMDWTDRHCRAFHRALTRRALLYTEMVTADAIIHGDRERLLGFSEIEHPVALQLGGSDPAKMAEAARIGAAFGYDEINLNIGCPSDRVQSGRFGACLMREPSLVAELWSAVREAAPGIPVTIKCRIRRRRSGASRGAVRVCRCGGECGLPHVHRACAQGVVVRVVAEGKPRCAAARLRTGARTEARAAGA